jgi:outer membrane lipoprotein carrier protein
MTRVFAAIILAAASCAARADAVATLKDFVSEVKSGRAAFTQTVVSPDGAKKKSSSGSFEFLRPNRFRFVYEKPFEQLIVADGRKVWVHDMELNQVTSRRLTQALGATPAAILAGGALDKDFTLTGEPSHDGLEWVRATPKAEDSTFQSVRVAFRGRELAAIEIADHFGQRSTLRFSQFAANVTIPPERFRFTPPAGADVLEQ